MKDSYVLKDKMKEPPIIRILFWIVIPILGIGGLCLIADALIFILIAASDFHWGQMFARALSLLIGLLAFRWSLITLVFYNRTCIIDEKGFTIITCKWFKKEYCWSDISSMVLCDANYYSSHYGERYDIGIRIAVGDETFGPLNEQKSYPFFSLTHVESWRTLAYTRKHFNKVFLFEFTPERYAAIRRISGLEIGRCVSKQVTDML